MQPFQPVVDGKRRASHRHGLHLDFLREQYFQNVPITRLATGLAAISDHENDLPPLSATLAQIECSLKNGIIQDARLPGRCINGLSGATDRYAVNNRTICHWPTQYGGSGIATAP